MFFEYYDQENCYDENILKNNSGNKTIFIIQQSLISLVIFAYASNIITKNHCDTYV